MCQVKTHLEENGIEIKEYTEVSVDVALLATNELDSVSTAKSVNGKHQTGEESSNVIWADPASCCYALYSKLNPDTVLLQQSPLALPKALKVLCLYSFIKLIWIYHIQFCLLLITLLLVEPSGIGWIKKGAYS